MIMNIVDNTNLNFQKTLMTELSYFDSCVVNFFTQESFHKVSDILKRRYSFRPGPQVKDLGLFAVVVFSEKVSLTLLSKVRQQLHVGWPGSWVWSKTVFHEVLNDLSKAKAFSSSAVNNSVSRDDNLSVKKGNVFTNLKYVFKRPQSSASPSRSRLDQKIA